MILDVSKENCIRAAADGDGDTVQRYFAQLAAAQADGSSPASAVDGDKDAARSDHPAQDADPPRAAKTTPLAHFLQDMTRTLFSEAIENGHASVVQVLLSPLVRNSIGSALDAMLPELLHAAIDADYVEIVECLLSSGANANSVAGDSSALCRAAALGSLEMAQTLAAHGANVSARDDATGRTALHEAARQGDVEIVVFLLANGADANVQDYQLRETPLLSAVKKGNRRVVRYLVDAGAQLDVSNAFGSTALHVANVEGQLEIQQMLQDAGARVLEVPRTPRR